MPNDFKLSCPECFSPEPFRYVTPVLIQCDECGRYVLLKELIELRLLPATTARNEAIAVTAKANGYFPYQTAVVKFLTGDTIYV